MAYFVAVCLGLLLAAVAAENQECVNAAGNQTCDSGMVDEASLLAHRVVAKQRALVAGGHGSSRRLEDDDSGRSGGGSACSAPGESCQQTKCCQEEGQLCYEKDQYWASCLSSCQPGIHWDEPPEYQTPWSCNVLSDCSAVGEDCRSSKCCEDAAMTCYEKDQYWASCLSSCQPGIHWDEPPEYQTPWSCTQLGPSPSPTPPSPTPPSPSPTPPADCSAVDQDCRSSKCCEDAAMTCYEKDQYWASCLSTCQPGIHWDDPPEYQTPWSCTPLGPSPSPTPPSPTPPSPTPTPSDTLEACLLADGGSPWTYVGSSQVNEDYHKDIHNARVAGSIHPSAVVFATKESEVVHAVSCASKFKKPVYGRSGMNQYEASCADEEGGGAGCVLIDTNNMWQLDWASTGCSNGQEGCVAKLGPGLSLGSAYVQLSERNYALPAGTCAQVRVAGLTLGGGKGWLTRKYGLTLDRLRGIDAVLLDGRKVHASADEEPNLFWLARGGGGNIFPGVVTAFHFEVVPMPQSPLSASRTWSWWDTANCRQQLFKNWYEKLALDGENDQNFDLFARLTIQNFGNPEIVISMYYFGSDKSGAVSKLNSVGNEAGCGQGGDSEKKDDSWIGIVRGANGLNGGPSEQELMTNNCGWSLWNDGSGQPKATRTHPCYGWNTEYSTKWAYRSLVFGKGKYVPESVWSALAGVNPTDNFFIEIDPSNGATAAVPSDETAYPWRDSGYVTLQQNMRGDNVQDQMAVSADFMRKVTAQVPKSGYYNYLDKSMEDAYGGIPRDAYYGANADTVEKYLKQYTEGISPNGCSRCESWELKRQR